jgi:hypothetical protein
MSPLRSAAFSAVVAVAIGIPPAAAQPDHLKCYKVKDPLAKTQYSATLEGLTVETGCVIKTPAKLDCVPASKTNVSPPPPGGGAGGVPNTFACYKVKCPRATLAGFSVSDQFGTRPVTPSTAKLLCAPAASPTTTTSTSTTSTTIPSACCGPQRMTLTSSGGTMTFRTLPPSSLPPGLVATLDLAPPTPFPGCAHTAIVPPGGFTALPFCVEGTGFTGTITARGCASGGSDGSGMVWDTLAACVDADVSRVGDTSDPDGAACGTLGAGCNIMPGGAGDDALGNIDTTRGDGSCDTSPGVHVRFDVPVTLTVWNDNDGNCPDTDGQFDPGTDILVLQYDMIVSPTTSAANADFTELNGDTCEFSGGGPDHTQHCTGDPARPCGTSTQCSTPPAGTCTAGPLRGVPATGPCCTVGQPVTLVASMLVFTGSAPFYDILSSMRLDTSVSACDPWPGPASCTLTTDPCED